MNLNESRSHHRFPFRVKVNLEFAELRCFLGGFATDLSPGGMFLNTDDPKPPGSAFSFELPITRRGPWIRGTGEVVWVRRREEDPALGAGMGLRFVELEEEARELLGELLRAYFRDGEEGLEQALAGAADRAEEASKRAEEEETPPPAPPAVLDDTMVVDPPVARQAAPESTHSERPTADSPPGAAKAARQPLPSPVQTSPPGEGEEIPARAEDGGHAGDQPRPGDSGEDVREERKADRAVPRMASWPFLAGVGVLLSLLGVASFELGWLSGPEAGPSRQPAALSDRAAAGNLQEVDRSVEEAFRTIVDISWRQDAADTLVFIEADGCFPAESYRHFRLGGEHPREVLQILGASERFPSKELQVGTPLLSRIRTGFHRLEEGNELRIVLDLAAPQARLEKIVADGALLEVRLVGTPRIDQ